MSSHANLERMIRGAVAFHAARAAAVQELSLDTPSGMGVEEVKSAPQFEVAGTAEKTRTVSPKSSND